MPLHGCCLLPPTVHCVQVWRPTDRPHQPPSQSSAFELCSAQSQQQ